MSHLHYNNLLVFVCVLKVHQDTLFVKLLKTFHEEICGWPSELTDTSCLYQSYNRLTSLTANPSKVTGKIN